MCLIADLPELQLTVSLDYGQIRFYPACERSKALVELTGGSCFSQRQLQSLIEAGFSFDVGNEFNDRKAKVLRASAVELNRIKNRGKR